MGSDVVKRVEKICALKDEGSKSMLFDEVGDVTMAK